MAGQTKGGVPMLTEYGQTKASSRGWVKLLRDIAERPGAEVSAERKETKEQVSKSLRKPNLGAVGSAVYIDDHLVVVSAQPDKGCPCRGYGRDASNIVSCSSRSDVKGKDRATFVGVD